MSVVDTQLVDTFHVICSIANTSDLMIVTELMRLKIYKHFVRSYGNMCDMTDLLLLFDHHCHYGDDDVIVTIYDIVHAVC